MANTEGLPLIKAFKSDFFPIDKFDLGPDVLETLSKILITSYTEYDTPSSGEGFEIGLSIADELVIDIIGLEGFSVVLGGAAASLITAGFSMWPNQWAVKIGAGFRVRFPRTLLKPVVRQNDEWVDDIARPYAEVHVGAGVIIDQDWNVTFDGANAFRLDASMIADSGVVLEGEVALDFSETTGLPESTAIGLPATWRGIVFKTLTVHLPDSLKNSVPISSLLFNNFHIGSGGVSGTIALSGQPAAGVLAGFPYQPTSLSIELRQNCLTDVAIKGTVRLPFFDAPVSVDVGLDLHGKLTASLAVTQPAGTTYHGGLVTLTKPNLLSITIESIGFEVQRSLFAVTLSGQITPLVGTPGLTWPTFRVQELSIDSEGNVRLEGGWLDLREQYTLSLYGFQLEIAKIGFGSTDDGRRWIGFSGGLKLVDGLTAGASVEGLRILWDPATNATALTLNGVGVEFEVPGAVYFKGAVAMAELPGGGVRFDGDITLSLLAVGFEVEAQLVIGYDRLNDYAFFAIYLGVELPAGIPLGQTGLGLYGVAGLFALQMEPDKGKRKPDGSLEFPDEAWYAIQPSASWYHRTVAPGDQPGVTNLRKWRNEEGTLALGAGVTIGTVADNGFSFAGRFLLGIVFPGPILFIEGRANILKERASLRSEPLFRALAVLDARAGSFLVGLDTQYKIDDTGALIEIGGGAEAFFDFHNPSAWHLYLGIDEPRERRIRAEIIKRIFEGNAYFMLDARRLRTGAWVGYDKDWKFGPLKIELEAWIEGGASLSWKPVYLSGYLWLHGRIVARVFGFGFGLGAEAHFDTGVFDPFHVRAELSVSVDLPWPLPDAEAKIVLEWGPEPDPPLLPVPLKEVSIDHLKVTTSWPLPATAPGALLLPNPDPDFDGFFSGNVPGAPSNTTPPPVGAPVVPLDARPRLTFGRPVHDDALIGVNPSPVYPNATPESGWEWIGDPDKNQGPARVRTALKEIALEQWTGTQWQAVPQTSTGGQSTLWGSWAPVPQLPAGTPTPGSPGPTANMKLWLWSRSPYDYTRRTDGTWQEWFSATYPNYPCIDLPPDREVCCDFDQLPVGPAPRAPWTCPDHPELLIGWRIPPIPQVVASGNSKALCFGQDGEAVILLAQRVKLVRLFVSMGSDKETSVCVDLTKIKKGEGANPRKLDRFTFSVFDRRGQALPAVVVKTWNTQVGLIGGIDAGWRTLIVLNEPADAVDVTLTAFSDLAKLTGFDEEGRRVAETMMTGGQKTPETVRIAANTIGLRISSVEVIAPSNELAIHRVCRIEKPIGSLVAIARDRKGRLIGRFDPKDGLIEVPGREVSSITVMGSGNSFCLKRVCWVVGLSAAERLYREELVKHIRTETARWQEEGFVLRPFTNYRLQVTTSLQVKDFSDDTFNTTRQIIQCAYFRTEGPPGLTMLSVPQGHPLDGAATPNGPSDAPTFESGVEDLTRYVKQTIPATVAPAGEPPRLPRPVYRGYDVGIQFNEDYVEQMYRMAGRDLGLYLYDANGRPARDSLGRLLTPLNRWGRMPTLELSDSDKRWLAQLDDATCQLRVDWTMIPRAMTLASERQVLDPDTLYEGRLVPLLAHDGFDRYSVGASASRTGAILADGINHWIVRDVGTDSAPSRWVVRESGAPAARSLEQTSDVSLGPSARNDAFPGGTFLIRAARPDLNAGHPDQPDNWTDYRASVYVRSLDDDLIGLAVRFTGDSGYLVYLDQQLNRRRVVLLRNGSGTVLEESQGGYLSNRDYHLSVEASGDRLRVHVDGIPVFDLTDAAFARGSVALFSGANAGARFTDLRVDDLRAGAPIVYRFAFATSRFAEFQHHLLSFRDETWQATLPDVLTIDAAVAAGIDAQSVLFPPVSESEARSYASLAQAVLGSAALQPVGEVEVTRVAASGQDRALFVRTGEPIDWSRVQLEVQRAPEEPLRPTAPKDVRIARVGFSGAGGPNDEYVTLLHLNTVSLDGYRIERRTIRSGASPDLPDGQTVFKADLTVNATEGPLELTPLWRPRLVDLSELTVPPVAVAFRSQPRWAASGGALTQMAFVGLPTRIPLYAMAIGGAIEWTDYRFSLEVSAAQTGGVGVVVRYVDADNHYRIELNRLRNVTTLVRRQLGVETILWTGIGSYTVGQSHLLSVAVDGSCISATLDGIALFELFDGGLKHGRVGFLTLGGPRASFQSPLVDAVRRRLNDWVIKDFGQVMAKSNWRLTPGALSHRVDLVPISSSLPDDAGSVLLADHPEYSDARIDCDLTVPADGGSGLVFRWHSPSDHYRFVVDLVANEVRLVCVAGGVPTILYRSVHTSQSVSLEVEAIGTRIRAWLDGHLLFDLHDSTHTVGLWGPLAVRGNTAAWHRFSVAHAEPSWEPWFTFSGEPLRQSGACLTVLSGREVDPHLAANAGEEQLFAGAAASSFQPAFPVRGIDLRVIDRYDRTCHMSRFLPPLAYGSLASAKIVRAADGTGFALLVPDGAGSSAIQAGQYRVRFTYRRNNTTYFEDALVLSRHGEQTDEIACLDVPWKSRA